MASPRRTRGPLAAAAAVALMLAPLAPLAPAAPSAAATSAAALSAGRPGPAAAAGQRSHATTARRSRARRPHRVPKKVMPVRRRAVRRRAAAGPPLTYHGGRVISRPAHVYLLWYGRWSDRREVALVDDFLTHLGGSPYLGIVTTTHDRAGRAVSGRLELSGEIGDPGSLGAGIDDAAVRSLVMAAVHDGRLPRDRDGVYVVLTSPEVVETTGFGTSYCGWHAHARASGTDLAYAFVGDPAEHAAAGCIPQRTSPNRDAGADALISVLAHEIEEAVTDPSMTGWYDRRGAENADKCAWTFGDERVLPSGARTNLHLGSHDYLVQQNWRVGAAQGCVMAP